jgi:two-component system NtrC family sensor kinase
MWPFGVGLRRAVPPSLQLLLVASVMAPMALFSLGAWESHDQLYESAESKVVRQAANLNEHTDKVLETQELLLQQAHHLIRGQSWAAIRDSRPLWEALRKLVAEMPQVDALFLVEPDGSLALTTRAFPTPPTNLHDRDYFTAQRDGDAGTYLTGATIGRVSQLPVFNLSMRRTNAQGQFDGVIGVAVSVDYFMRFYSTITLPQDRAAISLIRDDGQVLVNYPARTQDGRSWTPSLLAQFKRADQGVLYAQIDDVPRLVGYEKLIDFPGYVSFSIDERTIAAAWHRALLPWAALALGTAALLVLTTLLAIRRTQREAAAVRRAQESYRELVEEIERRKRAEASLLQSQKLEALGQLTGGVAHDFNNLLQVVGGNLELIENQVSQERTRRIVARCQATVQRGTKLVQQLLAFARRQPLKFEIFDLNERILGIRELLDQIAPRVKVDLSLYEDLWPIEADATQVELALLNLVMNARDAMPGGGRVVIATANRRCEAGSDLAGDFVAISVTDTGSGIAPDLLSRVWEPFFTTKAAGKGTGLGLSMVYGFAKQSGGAAAIESELGKGTTVTIFLPKGLPTPRYGDLSAEKMRPAAPNVLPFANP